MNEREKKFRESIKLDKKFYEECRKQIETYNNDYESKKKLVDEMAQEDLRKQYQAEEQFKILSEFEPII